MPVKKDPRLKRAGVSGYNKPKRTPSHKTKSHVVVAKVGDKVKTIRFGQQGVTGDRKKRHSAHHTKKHMSEMRKAMRAGSTFTAAHKKAMKKVGK